VAGAAVVVSKVKPMAVESLVKKKVVVAVVVFSPADLVLYTAKAFSSPHTGRVSKRRKALNDHKIYQKHVLQIGQMHRIISCLGIIVESLDSAGQASEILQASGSRTK